MTRHLRTWRLLDLARMTERKASFAPIIAPNTRVLILGSLPGEASLAAGRYYANPQNQFWRLVGAVIEQDLVSICYDARLAALLDNGIGLWDAIGTATRQGSLDTAIRDVQANALAELVMTCSDLRAVAFNGAKSAAIATPQLAGISACELIRLPSSSTAHAALTVAAKLAQWICLRKFLR